MLVPPDRKLLHVFLLLQCIWYFFGVLFSKTTWNTKCMHKEKPQWLLSISRYTFTADVIQERFHINHIRLEYPVARWPDNKMTDFGMVVGVGGNLH